MSTAVPGSREWIRTSEVARMLGVSEQTVRRKASTKFNIRVRMIPGMSTRMFNLADVLRFKAEVEQMENEAARPR